MSKVIRRKLSFKFIAFVLIIFALISLLLTARGIINQSREKVVFDDAFDPKEKLALYEGRQIQIPGTLFTDLAKKNFPVLGTSNEERWIDVNLTEQKLIAYEGGKIFLESLVSTGLPWFPTPQGEFRVWLKVRATKMEGGSGRYYYNLPNVPYVMFFENDKVPGYRGYGLHGTYWHNDFGKVHSHGCVNLPTPVAEKLYYWTSPLLAEGKGTSRATPENPGTRIFIHN